MLVKQSLFTFIYVLFSSLVFSQSPGMFTTDYHIEVRFSDLKNKPVMLAYHLGDKQYLMDTVEINNNGIAVFENSIADTLHYGMYLIYVPDEKYFEIIMNETEVVLATSIADPVADMQVIKSKENKVFFDYLSYLGEARKRSATIQKKSESADVDQQAKLKADLAALDKEVKGYIDRVIQENKKTLVAKIITANKQIEIPNTPVGVDEKVFQYRYFIDHYWDYIDLTDERLIYTPIVGPKAMSYVTKYTVTHPDSINNAIDQIMELVKGNKVTYRYMANIMLNHFATSKLMIGELVYVHVANTYYTQDKVWWMAPEQLYRITQRVKTMEPLLIGKIIPDLNIQDQNRKMQNLHSSKSAYKVLFFYDPDCGSCKKEAPLMEEVRQQYAENGVRFWGIALDVDNSDEGINHWKDFIEEKGMQQWVNVSDLGEKQALLVRYDVQRTPTVYVLDEQNKIIFKRLSAEQLKSALGHDIERGK